MLSKMQPHPLDDEALEQPFKWGELLLAGSLIQMGGLSGLQKNLPLTIAIDPPLIIIEPVKLGFLHEHQLACRAISFVSCKEIIRVMKSDTPDYACFCHAPNYATICNWSGTQP